MPAQDPLVRVCALLNEAGAKYLDLQSLIASKETYREQDQVDVARLRQLAQE